MLTEIFVNGKRTAEDISGDLSLLDYLRQAGCFSVRRGCETSNCGICTVWVDEVPILSCGYPAVRANGKNVTTLEGAGPEAKDFSEFLAKQGGEQCGYCMPGFIMSVLALKRELHGRVPTREEVNDYLKGNLCRCSGYEVHLRAILEWLRGAEK